MNVPQDLLDHAKAAFENAYAPYSKFHVGTALRTPAGKIFSGANVENASYGLGRCGEQSAVQAMATAGERTFDTIVIYTASEEPSSPCGACRQILFEFAKDADVFLVNHQDKVKHYTVRELLPGGFDSSFL